MRAKRVDKNQKEIVATLREIGISVIHLHKVGAGVPDIACGFGGLCLLAEIKTETGKDTEAQVEMMKWWTGGKYYLRNTEDCMNLKRTFLKWHRWINEGTARELANAK